MRHKVQQRRVTKPTRGATVETAVRRRRDVLGLVVGHSLSWTAAGLAAGLAASFGLLRFLGTLLYGVRPIDPTVLSAAAPLGWIRWLR